MLPRSHIIAAYPNRPSVEVFRGGPLASLMAGGAPAQRHTGLILRILTVVDDLERALALVPDDAVAPGWLEGLQLVRRNLQNLLDAEGVTKIEAEGKPFEPWEHEAIFYEETAESEEGLVLKVFRDGYRQHDRIVRPAQVSVAKAPEAQHQAETTLEEE